MPRKDFEHLVHSSTLGPHASFPFRGEGSPPAAAAGPVLQLALHQRQSATEGSGGGEAVRVVVDVVVAGGMV